MFIPGVCVCVFARCFPLVTPFRFRAGSLLFDFALALGLGFALLMPGILDMSCPSCWANTVALVPREKAITVVKNSWRYREKVMS